MQGTLSNSGRERLRKIFVFMVQEVMKIILLNGLKTLRRLNQQRAYCNYCQLILIACF